MSINLPVNGRIVAERFMHSNEQTKRINGFDAGDKVKALKAGETATLLAPTGMKRIGKNNGTPGPTGFVAKNPRTRKPCTRRGVYLDPVHAKQAAISGSGVSVHK